MNKGIELANYGASGFCMLNIETKEVLFTQNPIYKGIFTGLYFKDNTNFFAIYPTQLGPMIYFDGKQYPISNKLDISLKRIGKNRTFKIVEYGIEIDYIESPYIGFDAWSDDIDVDLFYMIEQSYKTQSFYDKFTLHNM